MSDTPRVLVVEGGGSRFARLLSCDGETAQIRTMSGLELEKPTDTIRTLDTNTERTDFTEEPAK